MSKFAQSGARLNVTHPIRTTDIEILTYEGGAGYKPDPKSELFKLAVVNFVSENTFYESGNSRDDRFERLLHQVTAEDPKWVQEFIPWLRLGANMRSASVVAAAEYVKAGGPSGRAVVDAALQRADEPAEMLAYWQARHGRRIPMAIKRGVADAARRLYTEHNVLKYDGQARLWRFADVIELVHPAPVSDWQSALFKYLLDKRHGREPAVPEILDALTQDSALLTLPEEDRRSRLGLVTRLGWSWERLSGWLPGGMDAEAWEAVIPTMGVMALIRNLRNFDQAGISAGAIQTVQAKITSPEDITKSRVLPMRFLSAYKAVESERWKPALDEALNLSLVNVPGLSGRTLVMVDISGSMATSLSARSELQRWEAAAIFGGALALRADNADLYLYNNDPIKVNFGKGSSIFNLIGKVREHLGGGTSTWACTSQVFDRHDRVIIVTDEQASGGGDPGPSRMPLVYTWNVGGYAPAHNKSGDRGRYTFAGLSDAAFSAIAALEAGDNGSWPWES